MSGVDRSYSQIKTFRGRKALWLSFVVVGVVVVGVIVVGIRTCDGGSGKTSKRWLKCGVVDGGRRRYRDASPRQSGKKGSKLKRQRGMVQG